MSGQRRLVAALLVVALGGAADARAGADWREAATDADRTRLRTWRDAFVKALATARASGNADLLGAEGPLLTPDAALGDPAPPPGAYRCRSIRLGAVAPATRDFVAAEPMPCRVERIDGGLALIQQSGAQQPAGRLYPGGAMRMIFLGAMRLADEPRALDYGRDPERNMAGILERIGPERWRLVLPWPRWESTLQVIEIRPG